MCIAGPSGAGKTTLARALCASDPLFTQITSLTTRPRRGSDQNDCRQVSEADFDRVLIGGELVCVTRIGADRYGVVADELYAALFGGLMPVLVLDPSGVTSLRGLIGPEAVLSVWLDPTDRAARLLARDGASGVRARRGTDAEIAMTDVAFNVRYSIPVPVRGLVSDVICHALQLPLDFAATTSRLFAGQQ